MKVSSNLFLAGALAPTTLALQATTTRYYDGQKGACGCGPSTSSSLFSWQLGISTGVYTAAGSQAIYDLGGASWCGAGCGKCYQLTSTGSSPCQTCGAGGVAGQSIIVMVTNLCPNNGNAQWCPNPGGVNQYGFSYHFDIMAESEIFGDNVVVNFEEVTCPSAASSDYQQCFCPLGTAPPIGGGVGSPSSVASPPPPSPSSTSTAAPHISSSSASHAPTTTSTSGGSSSGGGVAQHWGQCGGIGWTGPTACVAGTTCQALNPYYSQCL